MIAALYHVSSRCLRPLNQTYYNTVRALAYTLLIAFDLAHG